MKKQMTTTKALRLALAALAKVSQPHAVGHNAFMRGQYFEFTERDHKTYAEYAEAIEIVKALIEAEGTPGPVAKIGKPTKSGQLRLNI